MIRSGPEAVPLRDGAAVHVAHHKGERTIFSIATVEGKELCSWQPPVVFFRQGGPIPDSFNVWRGPARMMHLTGDPIGVLGVHAFSDGRQEFRLDGEPARILFETPIRFLLRDPHPAAGVRTLESRGKTAPVYFVDAEKRLVPSSAGRETLEITLSGWRRRSAPRVRVAPVFDDYQLESAGREDGLRNPAWPPGAEREGSASDFGIQRTRWICEPDL